MKSKQQPTSIKAQLVTQQLLSSSALLAKIKLSTEIRGGPHGMETHGAVNGNRIRLRYCSLTIPVPVLKKKLSFANGTEI